MLLFLRRSMRPFDVGLRMGLFFEMGDRAVEFWRERSDGLVFVLPTARYQLVKMKNAFAKLEGLPYPGTPCC
jgi:hypothetical protein